MRLCKGQTGAARPLIPKPQKRRFSRLHHTPVRDGISRLARGLFIFRKGEIYMAETKKPTNKERLQEITAGIEQGIMELFESDRFM